MVKGLLTKVFGTRHERERKRVQPIVDEINEQYARLQGVSEEELRGQTARFRAILRERTQALETRVADLKEAKRTTKDAAEREKIDQELSGLDGRGGVEKELRETIAEVLDEILPEAFATVREAARRLLGTKVLVTEHEMTWDMVHYDVQLMGGIQLHLGRIAEMATGEGKTLVATLPLYLNAIPGRGANLVTVNSYLAKRDSDWMGHIYKYLGLTVGCVKQGQGVTEDGGGRTAIELVEDEQSPPVRPAAPMCERNKRSGTSDEVEALRIAFGYQAGDEVLVRVRRVEGHAGQLADLIGTLGLEVGKLY